MKECNMKECNYCKGYITYNNDGKSCERESKDNWYCTRKKNHKGEHVACHYKRHNLKSWR